MPVKSLTRAVPTGLRKRLLFLVLASVFPFLLLIGIVARRHLHDQKPLAAERALGHAQHIADKIDDRLSSIESVMQAVALSLGAASADRDTNDRVLQRLAIRFGADFASWRLFDSAGRMLGSSTSSGVVPSPEYMRALWSDRADRNGAFVTDPVNTSWAGYVVRMILPLRDARGDSAFFVAQIRLQS